GPTVTLGGAKRDPQVLPRPVVGDVLARVVRRPRAQQQAAVRGDYRPRAARLAAEFEEAFAARVTLSRGHSGVFDVRIDGILVFSRWGEGGRFPADGELVARLRANA
ncbi:MAG: Rdx family protein, partial [Myxococcales bacterium]|nr:Rdx family protein [Myxococcales bacterium]